MRQVTGGEEVVFCGCACKWANNGGSSNYNNGTANSSSGSGLWSGGYNNPNNELYIRNPLN